MSLVVAMVLGLAVAGCSKGDDDHKGHDHKPGEKHDDHDHKPGDKH
jgi:hypothetical protein